MKLIIARPSPYARKARVALLEKGIECEILIENPWLQETRVGDANPLGKVPALVLDDGAVVHDSKVIVEYLETLGASPTLIPPDPKLRVLHKQVEAIADGICDAIVLIALEGVRQEDKRSDAWIDRQRKKIVSGLAELERLLDGHEWFSEFGLGLAEIATVCTLDYVDFRYPDYQWRPSSPGLLSLQRRLSSRPSFAATKPEKQVLPAL
jgi:glutathione S-transferase